jgi:hypothetical protein
MHPHPTRSRALACALLAATLASALGPGTRAPAQERQEAEAASTAPAAEAPRRERRRAAKAAESPDVSQQAEPAAATVEAKLVCKRIELTGTKIGQRVCGTPEQWAARARRTTEEAQDAVQEIRDQSAFPAPPEVPIAIP